MRNLVVLLLLAASACERAAGDPAACGPLERRGPLPEGLAESSGVAASRAYPGVLWTHNDSGGDPVVFAIDSAGRPLGTTRIAGAQNVDWEDIAIGPCPEGECLFIADIGDNDENRRDAVIYRVPEPEPGAATSRPTTRLPLRYPGSPRDAEALFVVPAGDLFIVSKGRAEPPSLYRYPTPLRPDTEVELERVQEIVLAEPALPMERVTGAGASPDGRLVAVRTYGTLQLYHFRDGRLQPALDPPLDLVPLGEPQGEAVDVTADGTIWLTTEAGDGADVGFLARVRCGVGHAEPAS